MPYITQTRRDALARYANPAVAGELNYQFSCNVEKYVKRHTLCYQTINDVMGAYVSSMLEFYRRVAGPYEDLKIAENGDVFKGILPGS